MQSLDGTIARLRGILELGRWPSGLELTPFDRRIVEWNLELARREREERRRDSWDGRDRRTRDDPLVPPWEERRGARAR